MPERDNALIELVKEILGPRGGPYEILPETQSPRDEYITGVLAPAQSARSLDDIDSEVDEVVEETLDPEEDTRGSAVVAPSVFSPALEPRALPRSIGLSFAVAQTENDGPAIDICATWSRYLPHEDGWNRAPESFLTGEVSTDSNQVWSASRGVTLQMRTHDLGSGTYRVAIYLVNTTDQTNERFAEVEDHIFQPQIRVHCKQGTNLVPLRASQNSQDRSASSPTGLHEEESLDLIYQDRKALARGHLCGVTWKEIDPENPVEDFTSLEEAPFHWTDGFLLSETERAQFSPSDVRTELVPIYPVESPTTLWSDEFGTSPELDPSVLAETWADAQIRQQLEPISAAYESWIEDQRSRIGDLSPRERVVAEVHLRGCESAAERISQGIEVLASDEEARLAFCFANKAIELQSSWARGRVMTWYPFQLAFILLNIPALVDPSSDDRNICDLLWFPTGGGKTEAYLGLVAFVLALRRRLYPMNNGIGVGVISRYTLRLLTIQQFRRASGLIAACELLRVWGLDEPGGLVGWRPKSCKIADSFIWSGSRFSLGLWVGGGVAPNNLLSIGPMPAPDGGMIFFAGGIDILKGAGRDYSGPDAALRRQVRSRYLRTSGEPAQLLACPCCSAVLAVPPQGFGPGQHELHLVFRTEGDVSTSIGGITAEEVDLTIDNVEISSNSSSGYYTLSMRFSVQPQSVLTSNQLDSWWYESIAPSLGASIELVAARPARPGYFILSFATSQNNLQACDFDIYCPNPDCTLNQFAWAEQVPVSRDAVDVVDTSRGLTETADTHELPIWNGFQWQEVPQAFGINDEAQGLRISTRIPISAMTVDDQVYHRVPSVVIATVDKFARLAFEPKAASLFGNVDHYHARWGFYREGVPPSSGSLPSAYRPHPPGHARSDLHIAVSEYRPPDLILQDELHLIEGPLGSMVGLYEAAIELLCQRSSGEDLLRPKYVASTATVRTAGPQVQALFDRRLAQFPPWALTANDRFFAVERELHPLSSDAPGRLYVGICAPGKGAQTPIVRIWSSLLQEIFERWEDNNAMEVDRFYTLVGYFNAIRELAGAVSLYRQDIPERMQFRAGNNEARTLDDTRRLELSGRTDSLRLPMLLDQLSITAPEAVDAVFATSMFGTGVDVPRLSLMVVHGQPKTTSSYIQATGRVGRQSGGLVVTFFRATRPRDLDHYEFFTGYHRALHRYVEPVTVSPFSPRARERGLGALSVVLLRNARLIDEEPVHSEWKIQQRISGSFFSEARRMGSHRHDSEVTRIPDLLESRAQQQPDGRRPVAGVTAQEVASELDSWANLARLHPDPNHFVYHEPAVLFGPERHVVLGDAQHRTHDLLEAFRNVPQSLREVEDTTTFQG